MSELKEQFEKKAEEFIQVKEGLIKNYRISTKEMEALRLLFKMKEPSTVGGLTGPLKVSHSRITRIMDTLVRMKYSTRTPSKNDRRSWMAQITKKGLELIEEYNAALDEFFEETE